jgi:hypothetical protein
VSPSRFGPIHSWLKSLQRATEIALEMVTRHGVDETIGQRTYTSDVDLTSSDLGRLTMIAAPRQCEERLRGGRTRKIS